MRVSAESKRITDLMDQVAEGQYRVPEFQRDFVWEAGKICMFFDSILRGYPVGSIILWSPKTEKFRCIENIGGVIVVRNDQGASNERETYILDGRQRITSLLSVLHPEGSNFDRYYVNLEDNSVVTRQRNIKDAPEILKLGNAYDPVLLLDHIERIKLSTIDDSLKKQYIERAKTVNKLLNRYTIGTVTVNDGEIQDAAEVFSRLNSQGEKISEDFMIQALAYNKDNGFLFGNAITEIIRGLGEYNLDNIKRDDVFKCVYNYIDKPYFDGGIKDIIDKKTQLPHIMEKLGNDLYRVAEFLYKDCGVIDASLLPYGLQLIFLSYYFRVNEDLTDEDRNKLRKWFFYTTYTSNFAGQSYSQTRKEWQQFREFSHHRSGDPLYGDKAAYGDTSEGYELECMDFDVSKGFTLGRVRSIAFALSYILRKKKNQPESTLEFFNLPGVSPRTFGSTFICTSKKEKKRVREYFKNISSGQGGVIPEFQSLSDDEMEMTPEMIILFKEKKLVRFVERRTKALIDKEKAFVRQILMA